MTLSRNGDPHIRINKYLADSGVASRREADKIILEGRVKLNGKPVQSLSVKVNADNDTVTVDGIKVKPETNLVYIMLNKPKGCVVSLKDEKGRRTVMDYIHITEKRIFPVGRLDYDSQGLLLLTNDGELAHKLTHPVFEIPKTYVVRIEGELSSTEIDKLKRGIVLDGKQLNRCKIKHTESKNGLATYEVTITQGKNRQIKRMFEAIQKNVVFLNRISIGELRLGGLSRGSARFLNEYEIEYLKKI